MAVCFFNPDFEIGLVEEEVFDIWTRKVFDHREERFSKCFEITYRETILT